MDLTTKFAAKPGELVPVEGVESKFDPSKDLGTGELIPVEPEAPVEKPLPASLAMHKPSLENLSKGLLRPSPKLFEFILGKAGVPEAPKKGISKSLAEAVSVGTSPVAAAMVAATGVPVLGPYLGLALVGKGVSDTIESGGQAVEAAQQGRTEDAWKAGTDAALNVVDIGTGAVMGRKAGIVKEALGPRGEVGAIFPKGDEPGLKNAPQGYTEGPVALRDKSISGFQPDKEVDFQQLENRWKNQVSKSEYDWYTEQGLQKQFSGKKVKPAEVADWMEKQAPKTEVEVLPAKTEAPEEYVKATEELSNLTHELEGLRDTEGRMLGYDRTDPNAELYRFDGTQYKAYAEDDPLLPPRAKEIRKRIRELMPIQEKYKDDPSVQGNDSATAKYTTVNPKPLDKLDGAVDLLVKIPVGRKGVQYSADAHYPKSGDNLLAHVRGNMEQTPDGKKVFHVFELQSDWAQAHRDLKESGPGFDSMNGEDVTAADIKSLENPLLPHHQRLALKHAIEYAKKQGATHIALSDAETAMLTEGHDRGLRRQVDGPPYYTSEAAAVASMRRIQPQYDFPLRVEKVGNSWIVKGEAAESRRPTQEPGMRLNYDQILPKYLEELTGVKGERAEFGEHQNVVDTHSPANAVGYPTRQAAERLAELNGWDKESVIQRADGSWGFKSNVRKDLIFKNPDGTPKTSISARLYPLSNVREKFSMFGSDKAVKRPQGMQVAAAVEKNKEAGMVMAPKGPQIPKAQKPLKGSDLIPDFQKKDLANEVHSLKMGLQKYDKPVVPGTGGKRLPSLFGTQGKIKDVSDIPIAAFKGEYFADGPTKRAAYHEQVKGEFDNSFPVDDAGKTRWTGKPKLQTVFKRLMVDPKAYPLTKEEARVFQNVVKPTLERIREMRNLYGLDTKKNPYGLNKLKHQGNAESLVTNAVGKLYDDIAMKRLETDPLMLGMNMAKVKRELKLRSDSVWQTATLINSISKTLKTGLDVGAPLIQGSFLLGSSLTQPKHGVAWGKGVVKSLQAVAHEGYANEYFRKNRKLMQEAGSYGMSFGQLQEHRGGQGGQQFVSELIEDIGRTVPGTRTASKIVKGAFDASARQFQTFMDVARLELWKTYREVYPKEKWAEAARYVDNLMLSGRAESAGLDSRRALMERVVFYAPAYYRAAFGLMNGLFQPGITRRQTARSLVGFVGATYAMYYAVGHMAGMSEEEMSSRAVPGSDDFLKWRVPDGAGKEINVGPGSILTSLAHLAGNVMEKFTDADKKALFSDQPDRSPIARWMRSHSSPFVNFLYTRARGRNYMDQKEGWHETISNLLVPQWMEGDKALKARGAEFAGLSTYPADPSAKTVAAKMFPNRKLEELSSRERAAVQKELTNKRATLDTKDRESMNTRRVQRDFEQLERIEGQLSKGQREFLKGHGLQLPLLEDSFSVGGKPPGLGRASKFFGEATKVPMTKEESQKYEGLVVQFYRQAITELQQGGGLEGLPLEKKKERLSEKLSLARQRAKRAMGK